MRGSNSQNHAVERFHLRAKNYRNWKHEGVDLSPMIHVIYAFYTMYAKMFRKSRTKLSEFIAKCCWTIPYVLERIYVRYLFFTNDKDNKYLK